MSKANNLTLKGENSMTKIQEAKLVLKKAGYKIQEGSFDPKRFEYNRGRQGDNNPNDGKPTGVKYSKNGNIHEGEGAKAFLEARKVLAKAGYKVVREDIVEDQDQDLEQEEVVESTKVSKAKALIEARKTLRKAGYKIVREDYDQDIDYKSNVSVPSESKEYADNFPGTNTGDEEINQQNTPAASTEKGDLHEALVVLKKAGIKVVRESKKIKEFYTEDYDSEGLDDEYFDDRPDFEDDFEEGFNPPVESDPFEASDLDYVDDLVSDAANFDDEGNLRGI
jgi:hypothetical protein